MAAGAGQASEDELVQRAIQASLMTDALSFQVDELALFYTIEAFKEEARAKGILDFLTEEQIREAALTNMRAAR